MDKKKVKLLLIAAIGTLFWSCDSKQTPSPMTEHVEAELISEVRHIEPGVPFWVALRLKMEEGWHINWKNPGDAGLAPTINWDLPVGFTAGAIKWPVPHRIPVADMMLFGYEGTILLPVEITPSAEINDDEIKLTAACDWVVCGDVCLPGETNLSIELPVKEFSAEPDSAHAREFAAMRNKLPQKNTDFNVYGSITENSIIITLSPVSEDSNTLTKVFFFPEKQGIINNTADQKFSSVKDAYKLEVQRDKWGAEIPEKLDGVLIVYKNGASTTGFEVEFPMQKDANLRN
jgi:thiol:disulfide interchange protein DsbD